MAGGELVGRRRPRRRERREGLVQRAEPLGPFGVLARRVIAGEGLVGDDVDTPS
jgi:hypothetical protein